MARQFAFRHRWLHAIMAESSGLKTGPRVVAAALWRHMDSEGGSCYPTINTLAKECAMNERSARTHLKSLDDKGWLARGFRMVKNENGDLVPWRSGKGWRRYQYSGLIPDGAETMPARRNEADSELPVGAGNLSDVGAGPLPAKPIQFLTDGLAGKGMGQSNDEWLADYEKAGAD